MRAAILAILLASSTAYADDVELVPAPAVPAELAAGGGLCDDAIRDPIELGFADTNVDAPRTACLRSTASVRPIARALIATDDFYGTLGGGVMLDLREHSLGVELGVGVRVVDATFVQNAVLTATDLRYGPLSAHVAVPLRARPAFRVTGFARLDLPFTTSRLDVNTGAAQLAAIASLELSRCIAIHGRAAVLGWYGSSAGGTTRRGAGLASADLAQRIHWPGLVGLLGVEAQGGWFGAGLDHLAIRAGLHWRLGAEHRMDVGAVVPLLGEDRTDAVVTIGYHHDL